MQTDYESSVIKKENFSNEHWHNSEEIINNKDDYAEWDNEIDNETRENNIHLDYYKDKYCEERISIQEDLYQINDNNEFNDNNSNYEDNVYDNTENENDNIDDLLFCDCIDSYLDEEVEVKSSEVKDKDKDKDNETRCFYCNKITYNKFNIGKYACSKVNSNISNYSSNNKKLNLETKL